MNDHWPTLALLAFTPEQAPQRHLVVRPHNADPDPDLLAVANAEEDPQTAGRMRLAVHNEARQRSTRCTIGPDPDPEPLRHDQREVFRQEPDEHVLLEHLPGALAQMMAEANVGALQVWVAMVTAGAPCDDMTPQWFTVLLPRVTLRDWHTSTYRLRPQFNVEGTLCRGRTAHLPYGHLPDNAVDLACKRLAYVTDTLPEPTGEAKDSGLPATG